MVITKVLDENDVIEVERYGYEYEARKSVIAEMLAQDMDISTTAFNNYQKELVKYKALFENEKKEIENKYVKDVPNWTNWNLDYKSRVLSITVGE